MRWISSSVLVAVLAAAAPAAAVAIFYDDRASWLADVGAPTFSEDFEGYTEDTSFQTAAVALDGMTIEQVGSGSFRNVIDVGPPFDWTEHDGSNHASLFTNAEGGPTPAIDVRIAFDQPNRAFGFDHWGAADGEGARLEIYDGAVLLAAHDLSNAFGGFLGYVLDLGQSATSVLFVSIENRVEPGDPGEGFGIDALVGVAVPEPGPLPLLALGLALLAGRGPRRR